MNIKFIRSESAVTFYLTTTDDVEYRCGDKGKNWERLYGESWEPVYGSEEEDCLRAWIDFYGPMTS